MKKPRIKKPEAPKIKANGDWHMSFNFSELADYSYTGARNNNKFFIEFLQRLKKLSELTWEVICQSPRHSFGFETIDRECLKKAAQNKVSPEVKKLFVFRATGNNHVFLGNLNGHIFNIILIEYNFGDVYKH